MTKFEIFEKYLSSPRMERYLFAKNFDKELCISLYKSNLNISKSFHPIIGIFEVVLRNEINNTLSKHFNDTEWILNQQNQFMIHPSLSYYDKKSGKVIDNRFIFNSVKNAKDKLSKNFNLITSNKVIAEQSLGFWTELFEKNYYKILKGRPIKIFKNLPANVNRIEVLNILNRIRKFRNRINHNEPICFNKNEVDFQSLKLIYHSIINILYWINPETLFLLNDIDSVYFSINQAINETS